MLPNPKLEAFLADAPIFLQPWWLEAATPGRWDFAIVKLGDDIVAAMPYTLKRWLFRPTIVETSLTPFMGPCIKKSKAKNAKSLSQEMQLMDELIDALPRAVSCTFSFHPGITNWLPFYWRGFTQTTRYTYRIKDTSNLTAIWNNATTSVRSRIQKARKELIITETDQYDNILSLNQMTWQRQGKSALPCRTEDTLVRILHACKTRQQLKIIEARDRDGLCHSSVAYVWDNSYVYAFFSGANPGLRSSGAGVLLKWHGIELAHKLSKGFDFEGSMVRSIEEFNSSFGAEQVAYFVVSRVNSRILASAVQILGFIKHSIQTKVGFLVARRGL